MATEPIIQPEPVQKPRKPYRARLSKEQREYQEAVLMKCGLTGEFRPNAHLVFQLAMALVEARKERRGILKAICNLFQK